MGVILVVFVVLTVALVAAAVWWLHMTHRLNWSESKRSSWIIFMVLLLLGLILSVLALVRGTGSVLELAAAVCDSCASAWIIYVGVRNSSPPP